MSWESDPRTRVERTHSGVQLPSKCIQTGSNQDEDGEDSDVNDDSGENDGDDEDDEDEDDEDEF